MIKAILIIATLLLLMGGQPDVLADPAKTSAASVLRLEQRFNSALMERNEKVFDELLADDLIHIGGRVKPKVRLRAFI